MREDGVHNRKSVHPDNAANSTIISEFLDIFTPREPARRKIGKVGTVSS
jgi:hypothetical protein